jgi:hypothetical protein
MSQALLRHAVDVLNELRRMDPESVSRLFALKVVGSRALCAARPTHAKRDENYPTVHVVGALEMVNAVCASENMYIDAVVSESGELQEFILVGVRRPAASALAPGL